MSKLIPPLVCTTPPPIGIVDDSEDDEFGDFTAANDLYDCDSFSIPHMPEDSPKKSPSLLIPTQQSPEVSQQEAKPKDYQDKRKNLAALEQVESNDCFHDVCNVRNEKSARETHTIDAIEVGNVPICSSISNSLSKPLTNGHNRNETATGGDGIGHLPQLFDDDSEEKDEISETPSNFSISFDDNVIDDDDDDEEEGEDENADMPIDLPNQVGGNESGSESPKVPGTCKNIQEFDDFDDEWKQAEDAPVKGDGVEDGDVGDSEKFDDCEESTNNQSETLEGGEDDDFGDFNNAFASIPAAIPTPVGSALISCDIQFSSDEFNASYVNTDEETEVDVPPMGIQMQAQQDGADSPDDFEGIQLTRFASQAPGNEAKYETIEGEVHSVDNFNDFADFSSVPIEIPTQATGNVEASQLTSQSARLEQGGAADDDEFGDFDDYTTSTSTTALPVTDGVRLLNPNKVYEETQVIFRAMFEPVALDEVEYEYADATVRSAIFGQIKDATDTHALSYQWGKSQVQQGLLRALNVDARNILYAHGMPMPKFAANLGTAPLEPVKSDILIPTQAASTPSVAGCVPSGRPARQACGEIPAAQFDWGAAGLANPLDSNQTSTLFDLEQLAASLSLATATTGAVAVDCNRAGEDWDTWLQSVSKEEARPRTSRACDDTKSDDANAMPKPISYDSESVNSLQLPEMADAEEPKADAPENADDFSDFASFQSTQMETPAGWSGSNMIPLRETYIDGAKQDASSSSHSRNSSYEPIEATPTILMPDLTCKGSERPAAGLADDDFADFQDFHTSAAPAAVAPKAGLPKSEAMTVFGGHVLSPTVLQPILLEPVKVGSPRMEPQAILWPDPGITDEELARFDLYAKKDGNYDTTSSSVPASEPVAAGPVDPSGVCATRAPETKLSGPGGALMVEGHVVVPADKVILPFNEVLLPPNNQVVISKDLVLPVLESSPRKYTPQQKVAPPAQPLAQDEDDWCDFISTQPTTAGCGLAGSNAAPGQHSVSIARATELSLSIPQLRSMQSVQSAPSKPPIPVITPRGLVQTKIPTMAPGTPAKSLPQMALHVRPPVDGYQPAIISAQFAAQLHLAADRAAGQSRSQSQSPFADFLPNGQPPAPLKAFDDDEWSDFMSSQPAYMPTMGTAGTAGMQQLHVGNLCAAGAPAPPTRADWNRNGFAADLPNIITNPAVHFQSYSAMTTPANVLNKKMVATNGVLHSKNNKKPQNLNVARLPDLDFVAPKAKVLNGSKK